MANLANEFSKCIGHSMLMCGQSIASALWHDGPFIESPWHPYGSEVNVIRVYSCLEGGVGHVHLAKYFSLPAIGKYVG
jgi:hypothetical protein